MPIQQFGKEHHRTLSSLPQQPSLVSVPKKRWVISWWDREISIWAIPRRHSTQLEDGDDSDPQSQQRRKMLAKVLLSDEESIASVSVSPSGSLLAVSTIVATKAFRLSSRKDGTLKVQKLKIPSSLASLGGKLLQFSPDSKWLCVILPADSIRLFRSGESNSEEPETGPHFLPEPVRLRRLPRAEARSKPEHGSLGSYNRSINLLAFSADSNVLATSDLSGFLDTWVLEGHEDLSQTFSSPEPKLTNGTASSSDSDSSDEDDHHTITSLYLYNQRWLPNPTASLLPRLPSTPLIISFRPPSSQSSTTQTQDPRASTPPPTRHTPHPHSHALPLPSITETRLLVLTIGNNLLEFDVLQGKLTDWSRRNPPVVFPAKFKTLRDQAKGVVWDIDVGTERERVWLYGVNWLWMFDLGTDIGGGDKTSSRLVALESAVPSTSMVKQESQRKRKRGASPNDDDDEEVIQYRGTGAGGLVAASELTVGVGRTMQRIEGDGGTAEGVDSAEPTKSVSRITTIDLENHRAGTNRRTMLMTGAINGDEHAGLGAITDLDDQNANGIEDEDEDEDEDANNIDIDIDTDDDEENEGDEAMHGTTASLIRLRRNITTDNDDDDDDDDDDDNSDDQNAQAGTNSNALSKPSKPQPRLPQTFHTFKYRPILGIVPLADDKDDDNDDDLVDGATNGITPHHQQNGHHSPQNRNNQGIEVALVERPLWEMELPARFWGEQEWDDV